MSAAPLSQVIIIGAGVGGLSAALRLARQGYAVQVLEARAQAGRLAAWQAASRQASLRSTRAPTFCSISRGWSGRLGS